MLRFAVSIIKRTHRKLAWLANIFRSAHWKRERPFNSEVGSSELAINKASLWSVSTDVCLPALGLSLRLPLALPLLLTGSGPRAMCFSSGEWRVSVLPVSGFLECKVFEQPALCSARRGAGMGSGGEQD